MEKEVSSAEESRNGSQESSAEAQAFNQMRGGFDSRTSSIANIQFVSKQNGETKMAEQTDTLVNPVLQKKIDGYHMDNFAVPQELTVTITLSEYRELVTAKTLSDSKISEATQARWKVEKERDDLKSTLTEVKDTLEKVRGDLAVANKKTEELTHDLNVAISERDEALHRLEMCNAQPKTSVKKSK